MAKHTSKILRCEQRKIFKVWPFFNIMHERVNNYFDSKLEETCANTIFPNTSQVSDKHRFLISIFLYVWLYLKMQYLLEIWH